jgi:hypothetical protein
MLESEAMLDTAPLMRLLQSLNAEVGNCRYITQVPLL